MCFLFFLTFSFSLSERQHEAHCATCVLIWKNGCMYYLCIVIYLEHKSTNKRGKCVFFLLFIYVYYIIHAIIMMWWNLFCYCVFVWLFNCPYLQSSRRNSQQLAIYILRLFYWGTGNIMFPLIFSVSVFGFQSELYYYICSRTCVLLVAGVIMHANYANVFVCISYMFKSEQRTHRRICLCCDPVEWLTFDVLYMFYGFTCLVLF